MAEEYLAIPKEAPALNIPQSEDHVKVSIIDTYDFPLPHCSIRSRF